MRCMARARSRHTRPVTAACASPCRRWTDSTPSCRSVYRSGSTSSLDLCPGFGKHAAEDLLDLGELLRAADQRRRQLDHRVTAVVSAADETGLIQSRRHEAAQQPLALLVCERLPGRLVAHELDAEEVAIAADLTDDRQLAQPLERRPERWFVATHVSEQVFALEEVEVRNADG